jgi:hypothetical protein
VCLRRFSNDARLGHQQHAVDCQRQPVAAHNHKPRSGTYRTWLAEFKFNCGAKPNHVAVVE